MFRSSFHFEVFGLKMKNRLSVVLIELKWGYSKLEKHQTSEKLLRVEFYAFLEILHLLRFLIFISSSCLNC